VTKEYIMVWNLYWLGWIYFIYKLLAYKYLNNLNNLGRYCDSHLKMAESRSHISTQVQGWNISRAWFRCIHVCKRVHRCTELWLYHCILLATFKVCIIFIIFIILNCFFYVHLVSHMVSHSLWYALIAEASWNVMAHAQKPDFVFRQGCQFSRLLTAEVCTLAVVMLNTPCSEVVWRALATHYIRQFPFYFPSRASPCAITFQLESTSYLWMLV